MSKYHWSEEEEKVLIQNVKKYPNNLQNAFALTAIKIGRSQKAVTQHWYSKKDKFNVCFAIVGHNKMAVNSKNTFKDKPSNMIIFKVKAKLKAFLTDIIDKL